VSTTTRKPNIARRVARIAGILVVVWLLGLATAWMLQGRLIFPRWLPAPRALESAPSDVEVWEIPIKGDAPVEAWFMPAVNAQKPAPVVILTHGNAEIIDDDLFNAREWSHQGLHVLMPEYRGYGRSGGQPGQDVIVSDVCEFIDRLKTRDDVDSDRIGMIGRSIGCGVASQVALKHPPAAMVLIVPPARIDSMAWSFGFPSFLVEHPFRSDLALPLIDAPILIVPRDRDEIIPESHAGILHEAAPNGQLFPVGGTHNTPDVPGIEERAIASFINEHLLNP
tara:strand:- start:23 stop:865 length:843 start_codon:yes stop_codon:yes gene_type:complete